MGDAYDNAAAESFVDTFKTELITDRTWTSRSQLEIAIVSYVAWFNNTRLHESLGDRPPREIEELYAVKAGQPHSQEQDREPTNTVSAKPRAAQAARTETACGRPGPPLLYLASGSSTGVLTICPPPSGSSTYWRKTV